MRLMFVLALLVLPSCRIPFPVPRPTPSPIPTPSPTPTPVPTPSPVVVCGFPQGVPDAEFEAHASLPALHDYVNDAVAEIERCEVGSSCVLGTDRNAAQAAIIKALRRGSFNRPQLCAGQHRDGETDEISVALPADCAHFWEAFHVVGGPNHEGNVVAVWARVPSRPCMGTDCVPLGGGSYRGEWRIPARFCGLPTPGPTPTPSPTPSPTPPPQGACLNPAPGPLARMEAKLHIAGPNWITLDATPLVGRWDSDGLGNRWCGRDWDYCREIGFTDGRGYCPPRQEGNPQRLACDMAVTGGGISWTWNDQPIGEGTNNPDVYLDEGGWMLRVRRRQVGIAKACPRIPSGCDEQCGTVEIQ